MYTKLLNSIPSFPWAACLIPLQNHISHDIILISDLMHYVLHFISSHKIMHFYS